MPNKLNSFLIFLIFLGMAFPKVHTQDILQWRGVNRTGYFKSSNLMSQWPEKGPDLLLHIDDLPDSYSSVIMKDGVMYTTGIKDADEILSAINMKGQVLWNLTYGRAWDKTFPNARCTPTIEGDLAYLISGNGDMACVDIKKGVLLWSLDAASKFEGSHGTWGYAESPLIVDEKMIFTPGGLRTTMVALDKKTGKTIWTSASLGDNSAYCSPVLSESAGKKIIVTVTANFVIGVHADNGQILWKFNYGEIEKPRSGEDINPVTPIIKGNEVFVTSGYNHVGVMLEVAPDLRTVKPKWITSELDVHHGGVVEKDGFIYGANFTSIIKGHWLCLSWEDGNVLYDQEWHSKGSIIRTDDYLICYDERRGNVALVHADPGGFNIISEFRVRYGSGPHWSHPTIYDNKLIMRHGKDLMVYDIENRKSKIEN